MFSARTSRLAPQLAWFAAVLSATFVATSALGQAGLWQSAPSNLAKSATISVTVRPLSGGTTGVGSGQEGAGFGVALTVYQDDLYILLNSPSGMAIQPSPSAQSSGRTIFLPPPSPPPSGSPWPFEAFGMEPVDDHSVDLFGNLASTGSGGTTTGGTAGFNTAVADIQMDVGLWGTLLGWQAGWQPGKNGRLSPSEGGGIALTASLTGSFPDSLMMNSSGTWLDGNGAARRGLSDGPEPRSAPSGELFRDGGYRMGNVPAGRRRRRDRRLPCGKRNRER